MKSIHSLLHSGEINPLLHTYLNLDVNQRKAKGGKWQSSAFYEYEMRGERLLLCCCCLFIYKCVMNDD